MINILKDTPLKVPSLMDRIEYVSCMETTPRYFRRFLGAICCPWANINPDYIRKVCEIRYVGIIIACIIACSRSIISSRSIFRNCWDSEDERVRVARMLNVKYHHAEQQIKRNRSLIVNFRNSGLRAWFGPKPSDQETSPFFAKLPTEIRLKIYAYVVVKTSSAHVFMLNNYRGLRVSPKCQQARISDGDKDGKTKTYTHITCLEDLEGSSISPNSIWDDPSVPRQRNNFIPLLQTCHRM